MSDIPAPLKAARASVKEAWAAALAEADSRLEHERIRLRAERGAAGQLLDEAQSRAEWAARENAGAESASGGDGRGDRRAPQEGRPFEQIGVLGSVIREIAKILRERGWMTTEEIVRRLPPSLAKDAPHKDKALTPGRTDRQILLRYYHAFCSERDRRAPSFRRRAE